MRICEHCYITIGAFCLGPDEFRLYFSAFLIGQNMEEWLDRGSQYRPGQEKPYEYYKNLLLPVTVFLASVLLSLIVTPHHQGWICVAGFSIYQCLIFSPSHRIQHISK